MPTKQIRGLHEKDKPVSWTKQLEKPCVHPEHNPPGNMVFPPGEYEHTCPGCGKVVRFRVGVVY